MLVVAAIMINRMLYFGWRIELIKVVIWCMFLWTLLISTVWTDVVLLSLWGTFGDWSYFDVQSIVGDFRDFLLESLMIFVVFASDFFCRFHFKTFGWHYRLVKFSWAARTQTSHRPTASPQAMSIPGTWKHMSMYSSRAPRSVTMHSGPLVTVGHEQTVSDRLMLRPFEVTHQLAFAMVIHQIVLLDYLTDITSRWILCRAWA